MRGAYPVAEIRAAEQAMPELATGALMQRAAHALSVECARLLGSCYGARVALLVGAGNNGGDALYAGARLARRGAAVTALLLSPEHVHEAGLAALRAAGGRVEWAPSASSLAGADLVVDGIVGIGGRPGLRSVAVELAEAAEDALTVAVDVPSGVDADTGEIGDAVVHADVTVTFGALKPGLVVGAGADCAGEVHVVEIGLSLPAPQLMVLEAHDAAALLPDPGASDDKYTRGVVGVVAGSAAYPGAGVLCAGAAACGGAGFVRYAGGAPDAIRARYPEVVVHEGATPSDLRVQAWVAGPGMGTDDAAAALVADVLSTEVPVLLDADAITVVGARRELLRGRRAPTVFTPHDREFARLTGSAPGVDRLAAVRAAARELDAVVLLKGDATVVAAPDGRAWANPTGTPWLGTAGSGDVLSGLIGSLLASGLPAELAAAAGAYVHGVAGQLAAAAGPPTSLDVLAALRAAQRNVSLG